jgi:hypothetical protein
MIKRKALQVSKIQKKIQGKEVLVIGAGLMEKILSLSRRIKICNNSCRWCG